MIMKSQNLKVCQQHHLCSNTIYNEVKVNKVAGVGMSYLS